MSEYEPIGHPELLGMTPQEAMAELDRRESLRYAQRNRTGEQSDQNPSGKVPSFVLKRLLDRPDGVSGVE